MTKKEIGNSSLYLEKLEVTAPKPKRHCQRTATKLEELEVTDLHNQTERKLR